MSVFYRSKTLSELPQRRSEETEPTRMQSGGDVDLEAFMRENPLVRELTESNTDAATTASAAGQTASEPAVVAGFGDRYAMWLASKPPPFTMKQPRKMGTSKRYRKAKKAHEEAMAAWKAAEPTFDAGIGSEGGQYIPPSGVGTGDPGDTGGTGGTGIQDLLDDFEERLAAGELSIDDIEKAIEGGIFTEESVLDLISNYKLSEDQLAQLFNQGLLTKDQIIELVEEGVEDEVEDELQDETLTGLTEEQVNRLIQQGLADYSPDMSQYVTQAGLETLFQNYLTEDQLKAYLPQDQSQTISDLQKKISDLEQQYGNVTSQYEADAVNQQIADTKQEVRDFYASAPPAGPRTGSTSQFKSGASFLPGGSPMANLIGGQRKDLKLDPFTSYLKTFTPSYSAYNEPFSPEEYNQRNLPFMDGMYNNPFTGGMSYKDPGDFNQGGRVSNGIMDLTNFDTNVQPFQNAFRPNVPRN